MCDERIPCVDEEYGPPDYSRVLARNILRDLLPCSTFDVHAEKLGFIKPSDDVADWEHKASQWRQSQLSELVPLITHQAAVAGGLLCQLAETPASVQQFVAVAQAASLAVVAQLVECGALAVAGA